MKNKVLFRRFLVSPLIVTLLAYIKSRAFISPRAEVELSSLLKIGKNTRISSYTKIKASDGPLRVGSQVDIATGCFISSGSKGLVIGDFSLIGPNCTILASTYNYNQLAVPIYLQGRNSKGTCIGKNVLIGAGTVILDGAQIGDGVMIAPNSVVSGKVPANTVLQGNPAQVVFTRR